MSTPLDPPVVDAAALADELARLRIVAMDQLSESLANFTGGGPAELAEYLVHRGALTRFQAERVLAGETRFLAPGPYRLTGVLRTGTLGPVFRATHTSKPGAFAIKLLPLRSLWQARLAKQLVRSFSRFASHPGIVPLIDADSANGFHYLVWPATEEASFADRLESKEPMPPGEVAAVLAQLAEALSDCHAKQLPHGAITPQAIDLAANGTARLLDFGVGALMAQNLAATESLIDSFTLSQAVIGMLDFAAPELLADPAHLTPAGDLYSLGAVGFFALTCRQPFEESSLTLRLLARQIGEKPLVRELNPDVPLELAQIIDRLLLPNPGDRFESAAEVREILADVAEQLDQSRPVLMARGSAPLRDLHDAEPADVARAVPLEFGQGSGTVSWGSVGSGVARPVERDGSDASITFDLPPDPATEDPIRPLESVDTPRSSLNETRPESTPMSRGRRSSSSRFSPPAGPTSTPPALSASPAQTDDTNMAKTNLPAAIDLNSHPALPVLPTTPPTMPEPVQWHTSSEREPAEPAPATNAEPVPTNSVLWKKVKRNLLFWQPPTDPVVISVFGPATATPGNTIRVTVFLHHPDSADSVQTLSRAFQHDAELIGSGHLAREVAREATVAVHLSVMNAAASRSMMEIIWRGQPLRLNFDLHVPWESPCGLAPGLVSVGQTNVRIGKAAFNLSILPRKG